MSFEKKVSLPDLPLDSSIEIMSYLSLRDRLSVTGITNSCYQLFQPIRANTQTEYALSCVVEGKVEPLKKMLEQKPEILFRKQSRIQAPGGTIYYNVSPYQLMMFLCDVGMKQQIFSMDSIKNYEDCEFFTHNQKVELGCGGADLVKVDFDPTTESFAAVTAFTRNYILDDMSYLLKFPLLANKDGIVCYQDEHLNMHFYYANRETEELKALKVKTNSEGTDLEALNASFVMMEANSCRRSSNVEHRLINLLFGVTLERQGIHYEQNGVSYQDSLSPFERLINAYRTHIRICQKVGLMNRKAFQPQY